MKCDIVMPVWNQPDHTKRAIEYIKANTRYPHRLIVIDNGSECETRDYLKGVAEGDKETILIRNEENLGFVKATNQGLRASDAPYVCLMNNDTAASGGWLEKMVSIMEGDPMIGLVNPRSDDPGGLSIEEYSQKLTENKGEYVETNQCMGFCMLIMREVIDKIGHLDEIYGIGGFDDTDFSKRAHLEGYKCVCAKDAYVYHDWHTSFKAAGNGLLERIVKENEPIFSGKFDAHLRVGYPICYGKDKDFAVDMNTSLGLAREWNWVHAWLNTTPAMKKALDALEMKEHQSLRLFKFSGFRPFFYLEVLFRLIERNMKRRKAFDAVLVSDKGLEKFLRALKPLFGTQIIYIGRESVPVLREGRDESAWRERARAIAGIIKGGRKA